MKKTKRRHAVPAEGTVAGRLRTEPDNSSFWHEPFIHVLLILVTGFVVYSNVLAMESKEIAFTLPVIIVLVEWMFFTGKAGPRLVRLMPFLLAMAIIPVKLLSGAVSAQRNLDQAIRDLRAVTSAE